MHLAHLLGPLLLERKESLRVNVTSGGAIVPQVFAPMYSACKAAVHACTELGASFTARAGRFPVTTYARR